MQKTNRREALIHCIRMVSAMTILPAIATRARAAEQACVDPDSESLRQSLSYVDPSPDAARQCGGCGFFSAQEQESCGHCMIMSGPVSRTAQCESWSEKSE